MRILRVRKVARAEIASAHAWYQRQSPRAAARFLDMIEATFAAIEAGPEQHRIVEGRLRRARVDGFPYAVYFKVFPATISVVGVIHGHRQPNVWLRRAEP